MKSVGWATQGKTVDLWLKLWPQDCECVSESEPVAKPVKVRLQEWGWDLNGELETQPMKLWQEI